MEMANIAGSRAAEELDPRVRRTRRLLQESLAKLMKEKEFEKISIGDIAEASTLKRATFYDHYPDKNALLNCLVASQFQDLIRERNLCFSSCEGALKSIGMGVCYFLEENASPSPGGPGTNAPVERAIVSVLRRMFLDGRTHYPPKQGVPPEVIASTVAWAVYGAAREWVQTPDRVPVSEIGEIIERLAKAILIA